MVVCSVRDFEPRSRNGSEKKLCAGRVIVPNFKALNWLKSVFEALFCRLLKGSEPKVAPMTVTSPNVSEIKLDRMVDDMRFLKSQMIAFDRHLKGIEAYLKPSAQQPKSKSRPWFAAAARATARTVTVFFAVAAATGAVLLYLGT
jgi:hypothetical protein